jgi:hypothetical protein
VCNCPQLPFVVASPGYWDGHFVYSGVEQSPLFFRELNVEDLMPELDCSNTIYRCEACGQWWWVELAPEETPEPLFALKIAGPDPAVAPLVASARAYVSILAHGGFEGEPCRHKNCRNWKLRGRELCQLHMAFP